MARDIYKWIISFIIALGALYVDAQTPNDSISPLANTSVGSTQKLLKSNFGLALSLQTKYIWRGIEMTSTDSAPVLFPEINYTYKDFYAYVIGGYSINGSYSEVDAGVSYSFKSFTASINDYYYPTVDNPNDEYFGGKNNGHWLEVACTYSPSSLPIWATLSTFVLGDYDKYINKKGESRQAYSTYAEIGWIYNFIDSQSISLAVGACGKSYYNAYESDFSVCNLKVEYLYPLELGHGISLPLGVSYIYNPNRDKAFVNFTARLSL